MSIVSQELLDELNKKKPGPGSDPTELEKFNKEYDSILKQIKDKKKKDDEFNDDASHIPGPGPDDDDDEGDGDEASHIPD